jgi:inner membrane protein
MVSRTGLKRFTPYATPILLLAANAPDIDAVTLLGGQAMYLHYHRHLTHALAMIPVMAVLPLLVVRLFARKPFQWKGAYLASVIGVATHPLLDALNVYGVRWWLPFSGTWVRWDLASLIDIWIWAALLVAALAPALARLVSSEIGARSGSGRGFAIFGLCFLVFYCGGRYFLHQRALAVLDSRIYEGAAPMRVAAFPDSFNPLRWRGLVETDQAYLLYRVDLAGRFDPTDARVLYKPQWYAGQTAAAAAARRTAPFRVFLGFTQFPYWHFTVIDDPSPVVRVVVTDLRFGSPDSPRFLTTALVRPDGKVERSSFAFQPESSR